VGVEAPGLNPVDVTDGALNRCCGPTPAPVVAASVLALTTVAPGTDVLPGVNLGAAVTTEPGAVGRAPRKEIKGRTALELGLVVTAIRACAKTPATLNVVSLTPVSRDEVILGV